MTSGNIVFLVGEQSVQLTRLTQREDQARIQDV